MALDPIGSLSSDAPWWESARKLREIDRELVWRQHFATRAAWWAAASKRLKRSPTQLRRYVSSLDFLERLISAKRLPSHEAGAAIPEATLSALSRLDRLSTPAVDTLLAEAPGDIPSFRSVLSVLDDHSRADPQRLDSRAGSRRLPHWFEERCVEYVRDHPAIFNAINSKIWRNPRLQFVNIDIAMFDPRSGICSGIECKSFSVKQPNARQLIGEISWAARFFNQYWLMASEENSLLTELVKLAEIGSLNNVGIAVLADSLTVHRYPQLADPPSAPAAAVIRQIQEELLSGGI